MTIVEEALVIPCAGEELMGIVAKPTQSALRTGVLIVVGGPQYRVGSHRQFVLLSRFLAANGYPVMRFDFRGMGDSTGDLRSFETVEEDIAAALEAFAAACPKLERVILWGLCDAASACLLFVDSKHDRRIGGLVMLNPWVRSEASLARTHIKHYYLQRLLQVDLWRKLLSGQLRLLQAARGLFDNLLKAGIKDGDKNKMSFQDRMLSGLCEFRGASLVILSGNDYTAREFVEYTTSRSFWQAALNADTVSVMNVPDADHTFSSSVWRAAVEEMTIMWLRRACQDDTGSKECN